MGLLLPNDFITEKTFGVEKNTCAEIAATTVAMDDGFTFTAPVAGTCQVGDTFGGMILYSHTAGANELGCLGSTNEVFQFVAGKPIRFVADITYQLLATELNHFVGCINAILTAPTIADGAGMKATGDHFGFYTPSSNSAVFANPNNIFCVSQCNGVAQITELTALLSLDHVNHCVAIGSRHRYRAEWIPTGWEPGVGNITPTIFEAEIHFFIDDVLVCVHRQNGANRITAANTTLMQFGSASENITDIATYEIRQLKCRQLR